MTRSSSIITWNGTRSRICACRASYFVSQFPSMPADGLPNLW
eukprot:CAMPEP_0119085596 /NCGR_PEP_ID=MMETSP1178-20130426/134494_1 /TAXON_ID=33656 /ORGANISM="unid sp, Strain CCMP2000" /LENGTH=41 /DNA_ID= /DNA_START= /DNA_END= /DNA_ORIENTATION=